MRYEIKAKRDLNKTYGDRVFNLKKGETTEVSAAGFEVAFSKFFDGDFETVREIPETDVERKRVAVAAEAAALAKKPKDALAKEAEKLGVPGAGEMKKAELTETVAEAKISKKDGK